MTVNFNCSLNLNCVGLCLILNKSYSKAACSIAQSNVSETVVCGPVLSAAEIIPVHKLYLALYYTEGTGMKTKRI
jgi:hypothetical protein